MEPLINSSNNKNYSYGRNLLCIRYYLYFLILGLFFISCNKPFKITKSDIQTYNEKILEEPTYGINYTFGFDYIFINSRFLNSHISIRNTSGQTLEELIIEPKLEITFKNDIEYIISMPIDTIILNFLDGEAVQYERNFQLDSLNHFKEEILLHKAQKVVLKFEIKGHNSIGYKSNIDDEGFVYQEDITEKWNYLHEFNKDGKFKNSSETFINYSQQFNISMNNFNSWDGKYLEEMFKELSGKHTWLNIDTVLASMSTVKIFDGYQEVLFLNFLEDLKKNNGVSSTLESNLMNFTNSKTMMWEARIQMDAEFLRLLKYKDSLNQLNPYPRRDIFSPSRGQPSPSHTASVKNWQEINKVLNVNVPFVRDSINKRVQMQQVKFETHKADALKFYSQVHNEMVEILKIDDFVENYNFL